MVLQIDTKPALELPIQSCNPNVCLVRATLRDQVLNMLRSGNRAIVGFKIPPGPADRGPAFPEGLRQCLQGIGAAQGPLIGATD